MANSGGVLFYHKRGNIGEARALNGSWEDGPNKIEGPVFDNILRCCAASLSLKIEGNGDTMIKTLQVGRRIYCGQLGRGSYCVATHALPFGRAVSCEL